MRLREQFYADPRQLEVVLRVFVVLSLPVQSQALRREVPSVTDNLEYTGNLT